MFERPIVGGGGTEEEQDRLLSKTGFFDFQGLPWMGSIAGGDGDAVSYNLLKKMNSRYR
jgi:hypothetical protein